MRKCLYKSIVEKLQLIQTNDDGGYIMASAPGGNKPAIRYFDIWNSRQQVVIESNTVVKPAVFVEFLPIEWQHDSKTVRNASAKINLHVFTDKSDKDSLNYVDLLNAINDCLHDHSGNGFRDLLSYSSVTDSDFEKVIHSIECFTCRITETFTGHSWKYISARFDLKTSLVQK